MGNGLSCSERIVLEEFLKKEFQAHKVEISQLNGLDDYGWQGEKVIFETSVYCFEIWLDDGKSWTVWVKPLEQWFSYSPNPEDLSEVFERRGKVKKLCSILGVSMRKYIAM